jgi:hypothetical protein
MTNDYGHRPQSFQRDLAHATQFVNQHGFPDTQITGMQGHDLVGRRKDGSIIFIADDQKGGAKKDIEAKSGTTDVTTASGHKAKLNADGSGTYTANANDNGWTISRDILTDRMKAAGVTDQPTANQIANFANDLGRLNGPNWDRTIREGKEIKVPATVIGGDAKVSTPGSPAAAIEKPVAEPPLNPPGKDAPGAADTTFGLTPRDKTVDVQTSHLDDSWAYTLSLGLIDKRTVATVAETKDASGNVTGVHATYGEPNGPGATLSVRDGQGKAVELSHITNMDTKVNPDGNSLHVTYKDNSGNTYEINTKRDGTPIGQIRKTEQISGTSSGSGQDPFKVPGLGDPGSRTIVNGRLETTVGDIDNTHVFGLFGSKSPFTVKQTFDAHHNLAGMTAEYPPAGVDIPVKDSRGNTVALTGVKSVEAKPTADGNFHVIYRTAKGDVYEIDTGRDGRAIGQMRHRERLQGT